MAQVSITELPQAQTLQGTEAVPIVQNGVTVQTTTGAIAGAAALNYPFVTFGSTAGLSQARQITAGSGVSLADGGVGSTLAINLTGAALSLDGSGTGLQIKTGPNTVVGRSVAVGTGLTIANGDGIAGNPTVGLGTLLQQLVSLTGTGVLALQSGSPAKITFQGTTNQISIADGDGAANPVVSIASNPIIPGAGSITVPNGTSAQRSGGAGAVRYNTNLQQFEGYTNTGWNQFSLTGGVTSFSAGTTGFSPNSDTTGAITLSGILNAASGGTGAATLTGYVYGNGTSPMTASTTIPTTALSGTITNAQLANSSLSFNGVTVSLGGSGTITATATNALTIGTGLSGTSYNGSTAVTIAIDSTVVTLSGTQTLTNKTLTLPNISQINNSGTLTLPTGPDTLVGRATTDTLTNKSISGSTNTLTNIPNSALTNNSLTVGTTNIALGATSLTLGGLTSVAVTQDPVSALQLATKQYVDSTSQGLDPKGSAVNATTAALTATYSNGTAGVGATLTNSGTLAAFSADGVTNTVGDRVLVKNQAAPAQNGIYTVTTVGSVSVAWVLTRATDMDTWAEVPGAYVFIETGTTYADTGWVCTSNAGGTMGTTAITWVQFAGAGTYTAGTGLTLTGTQFSLTAPVTVPLGGTGLTSLTAGYIPYGAGTSALASISTFNYDTSNNTLNAPTIATSSTTSTTPSLSFNAANAPYAAGATVAGSYMQLMLQNKSATAGASTNYVLSNNLGTDSTYYGEFGMNSSVFSASTPADFFSINNQVYFSSHDGDVGIGSGNGFKTYFVWGASAASAHVINASGALGLSTNLGTTPALSGTTGFGTAGQPMLSGGSGAAPTWGTLGTAAGGTGTTVGIAGGAF